MPLPNLSALKQRTPLKGALPWVDPRNGGDVGGAYHRLHCGPRLSRRGSLLWHVCLALPL
jgi:hypothetical protein